MKKNFFKGAAIAALALVGFTATAQEEAADSALQISGSVDAYFKANINGNNGANAERFGTSFYGNDGFSVGMANIVLSKQVGKVGFVADLVYGPTADEAVYGLGTSGLINQLFVTYAASESTTLTFGRFNTFLGYEVISPVGNFNYSTSYLFSAGPFSHTGLKADFSLSEEFSLAVALMNSTTAPVDGNENGKYTGGLQLGYAVDNGSAYLNFLYGRNSFEDDFGDIVGNEEETFQVDLTAGVDLSEEFYLGLNASYNDTDGSGFYGAALYPQYAVSESFTLGLRGEYFGTFVDGVDEDATVFATTLTGSYSVGALTIKPELRLDAHSVETYGPEFNTTLGDVIPTEKSLAAFTLAAIYAF